ncbi:hypothetical protein D3C76_1513550 [compost metagenome]
MPTAVMMLSIEKTMSSTRICPIAAAKPRVMVDDALASAWARGSTLSWISLVAFHSRNRPPAMRIMSFQEKV